MAAVREAARKRVEALAAAARLPSTADLRAVQARYTLGRHLKTATRYPTSLGALYCRLQAMRASQCSTTTSELLCRALE